MLENKVLPDGFMDEKLLLVPKFSLSEVTHLGLGHCPSFKSFRKQETVDYLRELDDDFEGSRSLFKSMSFNEFFASEEKYCKKCSGYAKVNVPLDGSLPLTPWEVIHFTSLCLKRITSDAPFNFYDDWTVIFPCRESLEAAFEQFTSLKELKMKVKERLFHDRVPSLKDFREEAAAFVANVYYPESNSANNGIVSKSGASFKASLKKELLTSTDLVIFDATDLNRSHDIISKSEEKDFAEKILFSPGLTISKFGVLPYLEFEVLKILTDVINLSVDYRDDIISLENNVTVPQDTNLVDVCETMEKLFDDTNEVMSNYATLYDVASSV